MLKSSLVSLSFNKNEVRVIEKIAKLLLFPGQLNPE
jgi:hypothetical protein